MFRWFKRQIAKAKESTINILGQEQKTRKLYQEEKKKVADLLALGTTLEAQAAQAQAIAEKANAHNTGLLADLEASKAENAGLSSCNADLSAEVKRMGEELKEMQRRYDDANKRRSHVERKMESLVRTRVEQAEASWRVGVDDRFTRIRQYLEARRAAQPLDEALACLKRTETIFDLVKAYGGTVPDLVVEALKEQLEEKKKAREELLVMDLGEDDLGAPPVVQGGQLPPLDDQASSIQPAGAGGADLANA